MSKETPSTVLYGLTIQKVNICSSNNDTYFYGFIFVINTDILKTYSCFHNFNTD